VGERKLIAAAFGETVLALLAPEKAASFEMAQSRKEGIVAHTSGEGDRVGVLGDEEQDAYLRHTPA
jgi:hypothetical protein